MAGAPAGDAAPGAAERGDRPGERGAVDRHHQAVVSAEARRLAREVRAYGPLERSALSRRCHAERWREGAFEEAVRVGLRRGELRQLPFGFIAATRSGS